MKLEYIDIKFPYSRYAPEKPPSDEIFIDSLCSSLKGI